MKMDKEVLKKVLKACEAAIQKLDKENKNFIYGTGYAAADKKCLLSAVEAMAVSYTHLDVYKRQPQSPGLFP